MWEWNFWDHVCLKILLIFLYTWLNILAGYIQFISATQSYPTLRSAMDCSTPGFPAHHHLPAFAQTHVHWVGDAILPLRPLCPLLLPSVFFSIQVFLKESVLHIRWPKYWSVSFSISPSNEYSGLISFTLTYSHPHIVFSLALINTYIFLYVFVPRV